MEALREQSGTMFMENQQELKLKGSRERCEGVVSPLERRTLLFSASSSPGSFPDNHYFVRYFCNYLSINHYIKHIKNMFTYIKIVP